MQVEAHEFVDRRAVAMVVLTHGKHLLAGQDQSAVTHFALGSEGNRLGRARVETKHPSGRELAEHDQAVAHGIRPPPYSCTQAAVPGSGSTSVDPELSCRTNAVRPFSHGRDSSQ